MFTFTLQFVTHNVLCEAVEQNKLYEGEAIYSPRVFNNPNSDVLQLVQTLNYNSLMTLGDEWHSLLALQIRSTDVFVKKEFSSSTTLFSAGFIHKQIARSNVQCIGYTFVIKGKHTAVAQLLGCVDVFNKNSSLVITCGSSLAQVGADNDAEWSALVPFEIRTRVSQFLKSVRADDSGAQADARAYASFLARASPQNVINLNKYRIVYRFCDQISLPVRNGTQWQEEYEFADSEVRMTATVETWGLVLAMVWVTTALVARLVVCWVADQNKLPDRVFGEAHILQRWVEEKSEKTITKGKANAFLEVDEGGKAKRITAVLMCISEVCDEG